jgi:hypothetical protein
MVPFETGHNRGAWLGTTHALVVCAAVPVALVLCEEYWIGGALPEEDGCTVLPLVVAAREEINVGEVAKVYGTVEPLVVTQPYVGKMAVVEHVRWTVTVLKRASALLA